MTERTTAASAGWLEVAVEADTESVEAVAELLSRYAYNQGVVIEEPFTQRPDGEDLTIDPTRPVRVSGYLPRGPQLEEQLRRIAEGLWHLRQIGTVGELKTADRPEEDWANAWKEHFQVTRIGRRFVIRPSWREYEPRPDDLVITLDPGMAFGTGLHPTTDFCLRWLEELPVAGKTVLDAGAGSGILSIGAIARGAAHVDAVEIDPVAVKALRHNLALNEVTGQVRVIEGDVATVIPPTPTYDLVLANIISRILIGAAPALAGAARPGAPLVLSGVITEREDEVLAAFAAQGCTLRQRRVAGDWVSLLMTREA
ncbi:MAG: 50S ribosomal protein L11 methyltransferase [Sphaerobacter sp.]|nr:50S ribosomal protein L11 methyltransferase [Sphaerobacter sp.]